MRKTVLLLSWVSFSLLFYSCNRSEKQDEVQETRTSGTTTILVDEAYAHLISDQIEVFKTDYPSATVSVILGNENDILPKFAKGEVKMIVMSRMLKPNEQIFYNNRKSPIYTDRFAVDGIALIVNKNAVDTTIALQDAYDLMKGVSKSNKQLVFDNSFSSTVRYFIDSAGVKELPKKGVYTLKTPNDVIKFVSENNNYIGVVGVSWLAENTKKSSPYLPQVKTLAVKNLADKDYEGVYYQPTQSNLINGKYPLLRNVYLLNAEGTGGLGTGFANWLASPRGQLIVLKSGLAPHELALREFNLKTNSKK